MITKNDAFQKGQGAQMNPHNRFLNEQYGHFDIEGIDQWEQQVQRQPQFILGRAKTIVNKVDSPDVGIAFSLNPYQGCEHGCIYCYARNSHEYWGFSAGGDFERNIIVKEKAPELFKAFLDKKGWSAATISLSGNTDCYQPAERKYRLTRRVLEIALDYRQPVSLITKNALVLRDIDLLKEMAALNICQVWISLNSLDEGLRSKLEPRTATVARRLKTIETLSNAGIPVGILEAPIIPGLNETQMAAVLKKGAEAGAKWAGYTIVRLNGQIGELFKDWLFKTFDDRASKVWHAIESCHGGKVNDSELGRRMHGQGPVADLIRQTFKVHARLNKLSTTPLALDHSLFRRPGQGRQLALFS